MGYIYGMCRCRLQIVSLFRDPRRSRACTALTKSGENERLLAVQSRWEGYGFQAVYSGVGHINQRVWVQNRETVFQETDELVEDFSLDQGNRELRLKNIKKSNRFCFGWTVLVTSVVSGKQLLQDRGDFGSLVQYSPSKILLNQLRYELRIPESQPYNLTQKFLKQLPGFPHSQF